MNSLVESRCSVAKSVSSQDVDCDAGKGEKIVNSLLLVLRALSIDEGLQ